MTMQRCCLSKRSAHESFEDRDAPSSQRRAVRVLIAIALVGCVVVGTIAYFGSVGKTLLELRLDDGGHAAIMTSWWIADSGDGILALAMFFLFLGAFFGGSTVAGGGWRAGTVTTVLTWEPRRLR